MNCPIPGCTRNTRPGELLCPPHWRLVPYETKKFLWEMWRFVRYNQPDGTAARFHARKLALRQYRFAREAAINAATPKTTWVCRSCDWQGEYVDTAGCSLTDGLPSCPMCNSLRVDEVQQPALIGAREEHGLPA